MKMGAYIKYYPLYGDTIKTASGEPEPVELFFDDYDEPVLNEFNLLTYKKTTLNIGYYGFVYKSLEYLLRGAEIVLEFFENDELYERLLSFAALVSRHRAFAFAQEKDRRSVAIPEGTAYAGTSEITLHAVTGYEGNFGGGDIIAIVNTYARAFQITRIVSFSGYHASMTGHIGTITIRDPLHFDIDTTGSFITHADFFPVAIADDVRVEANDFRTYTFRLRLIEPAPIFTGYQIEIPEGSDAGDWWGRVIEQILQGRPNLSWLDGLAVFERYGSPLDLRTKNFFT